MATSHARGCDGAPLAGQRSAAIANASLGRLLGEVDVPEEAHQRRHHAAPLVAEDLLEDRYRSTIGRT